MFTDAQCRQSGDFYSVLLAISLIELDVQEQYWVVLRPCSHCYAGTVIRHKFVPAQLCRHIGVRSHLAKLCRIKI